MTEVKVQVVGGNGLHVAFSDLGIEAVQLYASTERDLEVWELNKKDLEKLEDDNLEWKLEYGWWRTGECNINSSSLQEFQVNGRKLMGFKDKYADDDEDDISWPYPSLSDYSEEALSMSKVENIAFLVNALAPENEMTKAEFLNAFQP